MDGVQGGSVVKVKEEEETLLRERWVVTRVAVCVVVGGERCNRKESKGAREKQSLFLSFSQRERKRERERDPLGVATCSLNFSERLKYKGRLYKIAVCLCDCLRNSHQILDVSLNIVRFQGVKRYAVLRTASRLYVHK